MAQKRIFEIHRFIIIGQLILWAACMPKLPTYTDRKVVVSADIGVLRGVVRLFWLHICFLLIYKRLIDEKY